MYEGGNECIYHPHQNWLTVSTTKTIVSFKCMKVLFCLCFRSAYNALIGTPKLHNEDLIDGLYPIEALRREG